LPVPTEGIFASGPLGGARDSEESAHLRGVIAALAVTAAHGLEIRRRRALRLWRALIGYWRWLPLPAAYMAARRSPRSVRSTGSSTELQIPLITAGIRAADVGITARAGYVR
jgi:hypothetical protein